MTRKVPGVSSTPTELMNLHEHESDMFLDLFANDFCKIQSILQSKIKSETYFVLSDHWATENLWAINCKDVTARRIKYDWILKRSNHN